MIFPSFFVERCTKKFPFSRGPRSKIFPGSARHILAHFSKNLHRPFFFATYALSISYMILTGHTWHSPGTWLNSVWDMLLIATITVIHMWDMTHPYVRYEAFTCETYRMHMCNMTRSYVWYGSFIRRHYSLIYETWYIHMCDMTHSIETP